MSGRRCTSRAVTRPPVGWVIAATIPTLSTGAVTGLAANTRQHAATATKAGRNLRTLPSRSYPLRILARLLICANLGYTVDFAMSRAEVIQLAGAIWTYFGIFVNVYRNTKPGRRTTTHATYFDLGLPLVA